MDFPHLGYGNPRNHWPQLPGPQRGTGQSTWGQSRMGEVRAGPAGGSRAPEGKGLGLSVGGWVRRYERGKKHPKRPPGQLPIGWLSQRRYLLGSGEASEPDAHEGTISTPLPLPRIPGLVGWAKSLREASCSLAINIRVDQWPKLSQLCSNSGPWMLPESLPYPSTPPAPPEVGVCLHFLLPWIMP